MMRLQPFIITLVLTGLCTSCQYFVQSGNGEAVARVHDRYLYQSDLAGAVPEGTAAEDSAVIARRYIDTWVKEQLLLHRAELALSEEQKDFDKQIEEYRTSLLIYSYRQKLLTQKLDTVIGDEEIREYYEKNLNNFILSQDIVKASFVKVPLTAPDIDDVRRWSRSARSEDLDKLEKYSLNYAEKFDTFDNSWVYFSKIREQIPLAISNTSRYLRYNRNIETSDSLFHYFLHIEDHKPEGEVAPLELVQKDIRNILLNKRKIRFFQELESRVYTEGMNRNQFEIY